MRHFIQKIRSKPPHIRERIAYTTAAGISGLLAIVWIITSVQTGILGPKESPTAFFEAGQHSAIAAVVNPKSESGGLLGEAAAMITNKKSSAPAYLKIITISHTSTVPATTTQQTVIPF